MTAGKRASRGRPPATSEELDRKIERAKQVERLARETSTEAAARILGLTERQVRNIRKFYREEVEPLDRRWKEIVQSPESQARAKLFAAADVILSPAEREAFRSVRGLVGLQILRRLVDGAAAQKENQQLRAEIERLKKQAIVRADFRASTRK